MYTNMHEHGSNSAQARSNSPVVERICKLLSDLTIKGYSVAAGAGRGTSPTRVVRPAYAKSRKS